MTATVALAVNCYERTYREVLSSGFFDRIADDNNFAFDARIALINNVVDRDDATRRAGRLLSDGEVDEVAHVDEVLPRAMAVTGLSARAFRQHPHFLDYGIAMAVVGDSQYVVGWDAEVRLENRCDWITPSLHLLERRPEVFSAAPNWPRRDGNRLFVEAFERDGPHWLHWSFSDQVFLVRRRELAGPIYRRFAPSAYARHAEHPWSFESRLEAYQRASRRPRAWFADVHYTHNDLPEVVVRSGGRSGVELWQYRLLVRARDRLARLPSRYVRWSAA
jgi:hypothetical protein